MPRKPKTNEQYLVELNKMFPHVSTKNEYINRASKINYVCNIDGHEWCTTPGDLRGCRVCANKNKGVSNEEFVSRIENKAPHLKLLSKFTKLMDKIEVLCTLCNNNWSVQARSLDREGYGCPFCLSKQNKGRLSLTVLKQRLKTNNSNLTLVNEKSYKISTEKMEFNCSECNTISSLRVGHAASGNTGCIKCGGNNPCSKISASWLSRYEKIFKDLQHGKYNEYKIPNTRYRVDGYSKQHNIVFEFLGDIWHGNPEKYKDSLRVYGKTMKERRQHTMKRFKEIAKLGYIIVYVWEHDYRKGNFTPQIIGCPPKKVERLLNGLV